MKHRTAVLASLSLLGLLTLQVAACGDDSSVPTGPGPGGASSTSSTSTSGDGGSGASSSQGGAGGEGGGVVVDVDCATTIRFKPGYVVSNVRLAGEWHGFELATATAMSGPTADGTYTATVELPPGLHAYKIVYDPPGGGEAQWVLNPSEGRRKYDAGIENSAVKVRDCSRPTLELTSKQITRPSAGAGSFQAMLSYVPPAGGAAANPAGYVAELRKDDVVTQLGAQQVTVAPSGNVSVSISGLADGKYRVVLRPRAQGGALGEPVLLPFWIEAEPFDWRDALVYMVLTDRFRNGSTANDPGPTTGADPRGDWQGGDLIGLRQAIADGTLDQLGIRAIWLTPFQTNPAAAYPAANPQFNVTGYHGYWPIKAREVDPRLGGEAALRALVKEAHAHGIRILQDYVVNHVHEDHEYFSAHPDWFRTGCVCGTNDCDWTEKALECLFASYMPDIDHTVPAANKQFVDDAIWWLDEYDLDGIRVDAVKHVEEVATRNLAADVRETFEKAGTKYFLMGETAMGWSDCADPCNDNNYDTIARYVDDQQLDGQFDFVLYHAAANNTFAWGDKGMLHADYWTKHGLARWPEGSVMTPYVGSHDTPRFVSHADYRGQVGRPRHIPGNQWFDTAQAPVDAEPYRRARIAFAWLLGALPGAPLLYSGDEYGQWGGADPNNRMMWRAPNALSSDEAATLAFIRKLGQARRDVPALRRGGYQTLGATEDTLVVGRKISNGDAAVVALTRSGSQVVMNVPVQAELGFPPGTVLSDELGGPSATVAGNGSLSVTIPASGAVVLHP